MDKKEQAKLRKRKQRDKEKQDSVTLEGVTLKRDIEMVSAEYIQLKDGRILEVLPERLRYLTLSDGQVLDRTTAGGRLLEVSR